MRLVCITLVKKSLREQLSGLSRYRQENYLNMKTIAIDEAELHGKDDVVDYFKNHCGVDNEKVLTELVNQVLSLPDGHRFGVPTGYRDEASGRLVQHTVTKLTYYHN